MGREDPLRGGAAVCFPVIFGFSHLPFVFLFVFEQPHG